MPFFFCVILYFDFIHLFARSSMFSVRRNSVLGTATLFSSVIRYSLWLLWRATTTEQYRPNYISNVSLNSLLKKAPEGRLANNRFICLHSYTHIYIQHTHTCDTIMRYSCAFFQCFCTHLSDIYIYKKWRMSEQCWQTKSGHVNDCGCYVEQS